MTDKIDLRSLNKEELEAVFAAWGCPKYRATQLYKWFARGITDIEHMTDLPKSVRDRIVSEGAIASAEIQAKQQSVDGTAKYLFQFGDGERVESVFMKYKHGNTACISTQVGCRMGCAFCASTVNGLTRHLLPSEMLEQITAIQNDSGKISNIVLMGTGEPLDNYDNVIKFLRLVNDPEGLSIGMRHISLSTCGLADRIYDLAEENLPITLSVSLHAPNDDIRRQIMPISKRYDIDTLLKACFDYSKKTMRRISYEYAMIRNVNDSDQCAAELASRLKRSLCHVNLIPINRVDGTTFECSDRERIKRFVSLLESRGVTATVRRRLGSDIDAACGQLRNRRRNT